VSPILVIVVAIAAALGVTMVVYGILARNREDAEGASSRVSYRTLADVREQLRRRFEPTGSPVWIAQQNPNRLASDLASADLQLRPYEFRILQVVSAIVFAPAQQTLMVVDVLFPGCLLYTSPSPRDLSTSRMPSSA